MRTAIAKYVSATLALLLVASLLAAQSNSGKKSYVFKGTVTAVNAGTGSLMVANEKIEGWMGAMTMNYEVDNPDILKQLKKGDHIEATVYEGDYKLYKVKVVPTPGKH